MPNIERPFRAVVRGRLSPDMKDLADVRLAMDFQVYADDFFGELADTVRSHGFTVEQVDGGAGTGYPALTVDPEGLNLTITSDGYSLILATEAHPDGFDLSLAECVGRAIVQRINLDDFS